MATAGDSVTRALRIIGVAGIGRAPSAEEMADGLTSLGSMLAGWQLEGIRLGPLVDTTLTSTTDFALPMSHLDAIDYNLAARLGLEYGKPLNPTAAALADRAFMALQAAYLMVPVLQTNDGLPVWRYPYV